jgi:CRP-like cAMP-binding protein
MLFVQEKARFLKDVSIFEKLSIGQLEALASVCEDQVYLAGDFIYRQGDLGNSLYIVLDGRVAIEREVADNDEMVLLTVVEPHEYFGEISLFYHAPRSVTAIAMQDTIVLQIRRDVFVAFANQNLNSLMDLNHVLCQRLVEAHDKISELASCHKPQELSKLFE